MEQVTIGVISLDSSPTENYTLNTAETRQSFQLSGKSEVNTIPGEKYEELKMKYIRQHTKAVVLCCLISFGGMILGWDIGTVGGVSIMPSFNNAFGDQTTIVSSAKELSNMKRGLYISIFNIGCALGGIMFSRLSNTVGRRVGILTAIAKYTLVLTVQLFSNGNFILLLASRFVLGVTVGAISVLVPMFVSESAPIKIRGALVVVYQLAITLGILFGNILNYMTNKHLSMVDPMNNMAWKIPMLFGYLWAAIVAVGACITPESVHFLAKIRNDYESAKISYSIMNNISVFDHETIDYVNNLLVKQDVYIENDLRNHKFEFLYGKPKYGKRLLIGIMVMAFQQLSGINYFFYYGTSLFKSVGIKDTYATAIILSSVNFISTFAGIYLVESLGRRSTLIYGSFGMFICMIFYASFGTLSLRKDLLSFVLIIVTCLFISIFAITIGPVSFVVVAELFPTRTRSVSMSICSSFNWLVNFAIALATPVIINRIGFLYGFFFAGCLLLATGFEAFFVPETKNKTEEEIDYMFQNNLKS